MNILLASVSFCHTKAYLSLKDSVLTYFFSESNCIRFVNSLSMNNKVFYKKKRM